MKKVAIAGAGLAGLGVAWHLGQSGEFSVTVFDPNGIGGGASGVSTGLLHPFPGRMALCSWRADEGMKETKKLVQLVQEKVGHSVADWGGIVRLALTAEQERQFQKCEGFGCEWWSKEEVAEKVPGATKAPALWMPEGMTIYSRPYLDGLWRLCSESGAEFRREKFDVDGEFDIAILAMGFETPKMLSKEIEDPLKITRGRALLCKWPKKAPYTLLSGGHLTSTERADYCLIGSTYEKPEENADPKKALALQEKIAEFYPPAREFEVIDTVTGYRIARDLGYRPIVSRVDAKTWAFFGLGSRGLLYHALLGKELAEEIRLC